MTIGLLFTLSLRGGRGKPGAAGDAWSAIGGWNERRSAGRPPSTAQESRTPQRRASDRRKPEEGPR